MRTTRLKTYGHCIPDGWIVQLSLIAVLLMLLGGAFSPANAQARDIITFTGGHTDPKYPGVYFVDTDEVTLSRPLGATATREASITIASLGHYDNIGETITFEPGETTKTFEGMEVMTVLRTDHADAEYQAIVFGSTTQVTDDPMECTYSSQLELLQETLSATAYNFNQIFCFRWGEYIIFSLELRTDIRVSADSHMVIQTRYTDHTGLANDADDYAMSRTREVVLTPINVGAVGNYVWYLYRPQDDEYLYSYQYKGEYSDYDNTLLGKDKQKAITYKVCELGPFEVANPAEGAVDRIFFSREEMGSLLTYAVEMYPEYFYPTFSNVNINKTTFKSGETMIITATMDNWRVIKRARLSDFASAFGVTLNGSETIEPRRFTLDEATGVVTYYVTAPTVAANTTYNVDFGPIMRVMDYDGLEVNRIITSSEGMFAVTVNSQAATAVPATAIDFVDLPADGSNIHLQDDGNNEIFATTYSLAITSTPAAATDAGTVSYSVVNADGAGASIEDNNGEPVFNTGIYTGTVTLKATLSTGVSTQRTYHLTTSPSRPIHYTNTYLAGTNQPTFQFKMDCLAQLDNTWNWTAVNDSITVVYTHANGTTWTERYKFSKLNYHSGECWKDWGTFWGRYDESHIWRAYELPFVFTADHPDATADQIGQPIVSAEVLLDMQNSSGNIIHARSTATLEPTLKDLSFKGYSRLKEYYHKKSAPTISSDVMYLPTQGFIVGWEIPELNMSGTYNDETDGDNVPDWLELQQDVLYTTAVIKVHPDLDMTQSYDLSLYTMAQRTCYADEAMQRSLTCNVTFSPISAEGNLVYRVNGADVSGDLTFDNGAAVNNFITSLKSDGFLSDEDADIESLFDQTKAYFTIYDNAFEGAEVTLSSGGDTLQTLKQYKGCFTFMPPADGRTYQIDVYYPAFDKHYRSTFVCHQLTGVRKVNLSIGRDGGSSDYLFSYTNTDGEHNIPFNASLYGYIYAEGADAFFLSQETGEFRPRIQFPKEFHAVVYNNTPELKTVRELHSSWDADAATGYADGDYAYQLRMHYGTVSGGVRRMVCLNWDNMTRNTTLVTLLSDTGGRLTNATLNYACVDRDMSNPSSMGTATYNAELDGYTIVTDPGKYAEIIEVVLPGRQHSVLRTMNLWNYDYRNSAGNRSYTIVMPSADREMSEGMLETLTATEGFDPRNNLITATTSTVKILDRRGICEYSETADYPTVEKVLWDERFGDTRFHYFRKYAHVTMNIQTDDIQSLDDLRLRLYGWKDAGDRRVSYEELLLPDATYSKFVDKTVITSFSQNHCLLDFDITEKIPVGAYAYLNLQKNEEDVMRWGSLSSLENKSLDILELQRENQFTQGIEGYDLTQVDDDIDASTGKNTTKDTNKMFDIFNFSTPPTIPFTMNIERENDYFIVRGIYEQNMIPNSQLMDLMDAAAYQEWFNEQFTECMNAVNNTQDDVEDVLRELQKSSNIFIGVKGYISGVGRLNGKGQLEVNFNDGGIIMELSAHVMGKISFGGVLNCGATLDMGAAAKMGLQNANMAEGDVASKPLIDIITEARFWLKIGAWAEIGVDIFDIAEAKCGIVGTAGIDIRAGNVIPTYRSDSYSGSMMKFDFSLSAYVKARFLCFKVGKNFTLLEGGKTIWNPEDETNPYYEGCPHPMLSMNRENITKSFQKLSRKTRRSLEGTSLFDNVSGMAKPTYLLGGQSLLFNNLKTPGNYNDDRLQVYDGSKRDLVDTGVDAPMYDFAEAHNENGLEMVAFEQLSTPVNGDALESYDITSQQKIVSEMSEVYATWRTAGGSWQTQKVGSMEGSACVRPAVAVSKENLHSAHAAVIWQQGKAMFNDDGNRFIEGSLMLSRFDGTTWSEPMEIMRINRCNVPMEYKMAIKNNHEEGDEVLVAMTVKQDINNPLEPTKLVYLNVSRDGYDYKVRTRYTNVEANMLQMERVLDTNSTVHLANNGSYITDGANLVAYMEHSDNGRELKLTAVDMKGEPTGKLNGKVGLVSRMVNDYRLVVDDEARDLSDVALLWNQCDDETTENGDGTQTVTYKNRIYASKLCSQDKQIFFSSPIAVTDIESANEQMTLASMDGYLDGETMKVAYSASNESDAAAVREVEVTFENEIDTKTSVNPYGVNSLQEVPVTITVENKGYEPIDRLDVTMNGETTSHLVKVLPMEKTELKMTYRATDTFDGTIDYDVVANFIPANSNALKARRKGAAARPHRIQQSGTQMDVRQVDMALKVLSESTDDEGKTTIVAELNNASLLPLSDDMTVKVGLYISSLVDENVVSLADVTVTADELYDATAKQNKVKIVTLTVDQPDFDQMLYLSTMPQAMVNGQWTIVKDVQPLNNVLPVSLVGKYILGDANNDGKVSVADVTAVINRINGSTSGTFIEKAANVNKDEKISIADVTGIINIINK